MNKRTGGPKGRSKTGAWQETPSGHPPVRPHARLVHPVLETHFAPVASQELDRESAAWVRELGASGSTREAAVRRLHALLVRVARAECARRRATLPERGRDEVDHLAMQAANDALMAILRKLPEFRGVARFTTWACKFVIFEVSTRIRRHAWRERRIEPDESVWDALPDAAPTALTTIANVELMTALQRAVREELTERQRLVFQAVAMDEVPIDVLAERLGSSRGALYKTLHDARSKLRRALIAAGHGEAMA